MKEIGAELRLSFRNQLRDARAKARADSEDFIQLIHVFERIGSYLHDSPHEATGLAAYRDVLRELMDVTGDHAAFDTLFPLVQSGRNEAIHQGHVARSVTRNSARLALLLEEALMAGNERVDAFMSETPVCAYRWQPVSQVRQVMLENSFSFLPIQKEEGGPGSCFRMTPWWHTSAPYRTTNAAADWPRPSTMPLVKSKCYS